MKIFNMWNKMLESVFKNTEKWGSVENRGEEKHMKRGVLRRYRY